MNPIRSFADLQLAPPLRGALETLAYSRPTPIQAQAIPHLLAGRDLLGCAQTGTGKTAAFALPILQRLATSDGAVSASSGPAPRTRSPRVLVLAPTRELASQIRESFQAYGQNLPFRSAVVFGGVAQSRQVSALQAGVDIVVATPGRLLDLMGQRLVRLDGIQMLVLDEADRMLDMGFIKPIRKIVGSLPRKRQTMLFSATLPPDILQLAGDMLVSPAQVSAAPTATTADKVDQSVMFVEHAHKRALLSEVLQDRSMARVLVFTRTKHGANRVAQHLEHTGVCSAAIHGNKSQSARERALDGFKAGRLRVLVATDIAARGIDVDGITHVINFELPNEPESYVHRIGRTGRAGAAGTALSFCDPSERTFLRDIEKLTRTPVRVLPARSAAQPEARRSAPQPEARRSAVQSGLRHPTNAPHAPRPAANGTRPQAIAGKTDVVSSTAHGMASRPPAPAATGATVGYGRSPRRLTSAFHR